MLKVPNKVSNNAPNIVAQRLLAAKPGTHPETDLLAAFTERALTQNEQAEVLNHLARCVECREVVALAIPEQLDQAAAAVPVRSGWLSWPVLRWGAAVACVAIVGAAVTLHYQPSLNNRAASTPSSDAPMMQNPVAQTSAEPSPTNQVSPAAPVQHSSAAAPQIVTHSNSERKAASRNREAAKLTTSALMPETSEDVQFVPGRAKDASETANVEMSLAGGIPDRQTLASSAMIARAATVPTNSIPRWTLTSEGMLQRSVDSGKTWETILVAAPGNLRALTSNGFDIWVGGAKGALYHSMDAGQHWMQVQPVTETDALTADIVAIEFSDLLHGTVTTADQEAWITNDAGRSWQKQ